MKYIIQKGVQMAMALPGVPKSLTGTTIAAKYLIGPLIGKGSFGEVFLATVEGSSELYAIKKVSSGIIQEDEGTKHPQLIAESKIVKCFEKIIGFPRVYWVGQENRATFMVMELLGPTLQDLFFMCEKRFSLKTVLMIADQMLHKLEHLHSQNFVHRDLKPENFLIGLEEKSHIIHLVDFGLSKRFRDIKTHQHVPYKENRPIVGTVRYCSVNTHFGVEQSRRDDVEAVGYILLYFLNGSLPWQGVKANNKNEKYEKIQEKKLANPIEVQCRGLPAEFATYMNYCRTLKFEERPDYKFLRRLFRDLFDRVGFAWDYNYDWCGFELKKQIETPSLHIKIEKRGDEINELNSSNKAERVEFNDEVDEAEIGLNIMDSNVRASLNGSENVPEDSFIESDMGLSNKEDSNLNVRQFANKKLQLW